MLFWNALIKLVIQSVFVNIISPSVWSFVNDLNNVFHISGYILYRLNIILPLVRLSYYCMSILCILVVIFCCIDHCNFTNFGQIAFLQFDIV